MANASFDPTEDRFICDLIRRKASQLIGYAGFTYQDREDLEQDLWLGALKSLLKFNPDTGHRNAYVTVAVNRHAAKILQHNQAAKRGNGRVMSLNVMIEDTDGPIEWIQTISDHEANARLGCHRRSAEELAQLKADLDDVIATLPQRWQTLLELLKTHTMTEAAQKMGVPRTTLYRWMPRIMKRFEKAGMRDYLRHLAPEPDTYIDRDPVTDARDKHDERTLSLSIHV